jgi:hypothetical protein
VFVEGRGNWIDMTTDPATGDWIPGAIERGKRTPTFSQTDFSIVQEMHVSKNNERLRLGFEANFTNLFNQKSPTFFTSDLLFTSQIRPAGTCGLPADYPLLLTGGYNYVGVANGGATSCLSPKVLNPAYGEPYGWQPGRAMRFKLKFTF